jgi:hypothetical protein
MPTIIRQDGFRIVIYPNDHLPTHVHIIKADGEVRIDLGSVTIDPSSGEELLIPPSFMDVTGKISDKDVRGCLKSFP